MTAACMGGWCSVRMNCKHYLAPWPERMRATERLCEPVSQSAYRPDPHDAFEPIQRFIPIKEAA